MEYRNIWQASSEMSPTCQLSSVFQPAKATGECAACGSKRAPHPGPEPPPLFSLLVTPLSPVFSGHQAQRLVASFLRYTHRTLGAWFSPPGLPLLFQFRAEASLPDRSGKAQACTAVLLQGSRGRGCAGGSPGALAKEAASPGHALAGTVSQRKGFHSRAQRATPSSNLHQDAVR